MKTKTVISEELALKELSLFINKFVKNPNSDELAEDYPNILEGITSGRLTFNPDTMVPVYKLEVPVKNDAQEDSVVEVNFRTRIVPSVKADLGDGLNIQKQQAKYALKLIAYIVQQPIKMLDNFSPSDYDVVQELSLVFIAGGR